MFLLFQYKLELVQYSNMFAGRMIFHENTDFHKNIDKSIIIPHDNKTFI